MTSEERIRAIQSGQSTLDPTPAIVGVANPSPCALVPNPIATRQGYDINPQNLVSDVCGYFGIDVDNSATNATKVIYVLGGCVDEGDEIATTLFALPAGTLAVNSATFKDGNCKTGAIFTNSGLTARLNHCDFVGAPRIVGTITFMDEGSSDASFASFKRACWYIFAENVSGNFNLKAYDLKPEICSPCFNSNDKVVQWIGSIPVSEASGGAIAIPAGLVGQFEFCVVGDALNRRFTDCAGGAQKVVN